MAIVRGWFIFLLGLITFILVGINAQGLRLANRQRAAFSFFTHKHFDVILVQETHWTNDIWRDIELDWGGEVVNNGRIATTVITITRRHLI